MFRNLKDISKLLLGQNIKKETTPILRTNSMGYSGDSTSGKRTVYTYVLVRKTGSELTTPHKMAEQA